MGAPMKRGELVNSACPIDRSLSEVGDTWTLQILRDALHGVTRFTDFSKHIGLATNVLSARLQKLVAVGIFEIRDSELGNSHEYVLTEKGGISTPSSRHCGSGGRSISSTTTSR
ncbi:winged helix-turn-helix transcriptional regulator [Streptomyces chiangmaiensis]